MIEAMKLALEALERLKAYGNVFRFRQDEQNPYDQACKAIESLRQAIEQAEEKNCKNCVIDKPCIAKGKDMQICGAFVPKHKDCGSSPHESHWGASSVTKPEYVAAQKEKTQRALDLMAENARELGLDYEPVQAEKQEPVADSAFEKWWDEEASAAPKHRLDCEEHCYQIAKIAWSNGAYKAQESYPPAAPVQEPVAVILEDMKGGGYIEWLDDTYFVPGTKFYTQPQQAQKQKPWVWMPAAIKIQWGHDMVVADLAIDKDHTVSIYCERDQTEKVEAMLSAQPQRECEGCDKMAKP